ncbi:uncharacterized protein kif16bb isoform X1 [Carassius gibelio]|uniref:uncharacterized protein kif16bb isoform X1 n=1 Tax=Carassius gibelio TaxID=101364 RepID=UPI0022785EFE|nr:uncharacterized protein kif16bb isoform X1 [Carassius gibelio]
MASVRVAVRVRPLSQREKDLSAKVIIQVDGHKTSVLNMKENYHCMNEESFGESTKSFTYDFSYDSMNRTSPNFVTQEKIFEDLGTDVLQAAFEGYNACIFAYGQTGSGKSYTMMGDPNDYGLIPRICEGLFHHISGVLQKDKASFHMEVSYFEIYNERVRDLLPSTETQGCELKVREHPKDGPYVEALSRRHVQNYTEVGQLLQEGNRRRTTASTCMNHVSSRSHAIFTIRFVKAMFDAELPSETVSKVHLVDLAGSERANATQATGIRLKEGANINRSLVTLGVVISALADLSVGGGMKKKQNFVPYRDSVLTWLLKDSLGGNSKTIMIANISPADINYSETLNTLRYASRAKNILNKPTVNEDSNVKIIRELRAEIARLKALLSAGNQMVSFEQPSGSSVEEKLHQDEARVQELTEQWANRWKEIHNILGEDTVALRKEGIGVVLDSQMPYLICIDEDRLSTGVVLYHLKEGRTSVGAGGTEPEQDIVLHGEALQKEHCVFENRTGTVTLVPLPGARCAINGVEVTQPYVLTQGVNIQLGKATMFHFNHPQEAAQLREKRKSGLFVSSNSSAFSVESFSHFSSGKVSDQPKSDTEPLKSSCLSGESHRNNTDSSFGGPSESQHVPEMPRALIEYCATNNPEGDAKSLGKSLQTSLVIQWEKQHSASHKSETEAPSVNVTDKDLEGEKTVVNGELCDTRVLQECRNGTFGLLDVDQQYLCHPVVGSEGSLLAEESHIQSRHSTTGGGAAFVPSLTCLEHFSHRHSPLTMGGQFSKHFLSRTSVESQEAKAQSEGSENSSSLGSLVGRVSWMLADAGRVLTNTLKEQTGCRGSAWYNQICSMVKDLPLVHHIQFELTLRPQASPTLNTTQFRRSLSHSNILSVREQRVALSSVQDLSRSSSGEWKSPLMALEATQTGNSVTTQRGEGLKLCCQRLHAVPESLLHLQNLPPQQLLSCLHSVIPAPLLMEERVFALYWLSVATSSQPDPQPAVTIIFQTKLLVITFDTLPESSNTTHSLNVYYELPFQQLQEIYIGFAGQTVRLTGNTEKSILVLYTCNASLSQELSQTLLEVICPFDSGALTHPLLSKDMVHLSLNWDSHVKDLLLPSGGRLTCSFQKTLAKLVFLLHGNMQGERPALAHVQLLLYTTVRFQRSSLKLHTNPIVPVSQVAPIDSELVQFVLTDTHLGLLRENAVYHPPPCSVAVVAREAQFRLMDLRKCSDVRCVLVRDGYGSMCLDVVLAQKSGGTGGHSQPPEVCNADEAAAQSPTNSDSSPRNEVWKLTFSSSAEATFLINNLSNI